MNDREFLAALESCRLPAAEFDHRAHVRAAYLYSLDTDFGTALARMSQSVRAFATSVGKPERYHETITVGFMALIRRHMHEYGAGGSWNEFARDNPELLDPAVLLRFFPRDVLASEVARKTFVLPARTAVGE
jgi:hypothetical protein